MRGPQDDTIEVNLAGKACFVTNGLHPTSFLFLARFRGRGRPRQTNIAHFGTLSTVIYLIRLLFASICMYNPARFIS
jgi:hypothetical protein